MYAGGSRFPQSPSPANWVRRRGKKVNSWWMKTVRRDSGLAPTSEVFFELRVSEHRRLGCVRRCNIVMMRYWWWCEGESETRVSLGGREQRRRWHRIPHPDCPMAFTGQECISIDFQLGLWTAIGPRYARFVLLEPARFKMVRLVFVIEYDLFLMQWQAWVPEHS